MKAPALSDLSPIVTARFIKLAFPELKLSARGLPDRILRAMKKRLKNPDELKRLISLSYEPGAMAPVQEASLWQAALDSKKHRPEVHLALLLVVYRLLQQEINKTVREIDEEGKLTIH